MHEGAGPGATQRAQYLLLHERADALVSALAERYEVEVLAAPPVTDGDGPALRKATALVPLGEGARVTIGFSDFPGLVIKLGEWHTLYLPQCGCGDCHEDPLALAAELEEVLLAVADGGYSENPDGYRLELADGGVVSQHTSGRASLRFAVRGPWRLRSRSGDAQGGASTPTGPV